MTLLAIELGSLNPESCIPLLKQALDDTESTLQVLIYLIPELLSKLDTPAKRAGRIKGLQELLSALYVCSASKADVSCDIIFADWCGYKVEHEIWEYNTLYTAGISSDRLPRSNVPINTIYFNPPNPSLTEPSIVSSNEKEYPVVAVGGTFDHLHPGHKILLSITAILSSKKLICGVTDDALLKSKKYAKFLESISFRIDHVRQFLTLFARNLELEIVPIQDVYGPTAYDPDISALVISEETRAGADSIDTLRREKKLRSLDIFVIDVISDSSTLDASKLEDKMSSTKIRQGLAEKIGCR